LWQGEGIYDVADCSKSALHYFANLVAVKFRLSSADLSPVVEGKVGHNSVEAGSEVVFNFHIAQF